MTEKIMEYIQCLIPKKLHSTDTIHSIPDVTRCSSDSEWLYNYRRVSIHHGMTSLYIQEPGEEN